MNTFPVSVITPSGKIFADNSAVKLSVRTQAGQIQVLANHTPLVSVLKIGQLVVETIDDEHRSAIFGGFLEVRESGEVIILADEAERATDIDIEQAKAAKDKTQRLMDKHNGRDAEFYQLQSDLHKNTTRIKVGSWHRS
jgi:F-type H+-transporting ATPase subunit epsilon